MIVMTTLTSHLEKDCSGSENQDILEPLELVLRATKEFRKPSFKESHLQAQFGITVKYCQFSNLALEEVMMRNGS
jgi:hypothetical protein